MGPIKTSEMREGGPYKGDKPNVIDWGRSWTRDEAAVPPHASLGRRSSRTIDRLRTHFGEERSRLMASLDSVRHAYSRGCDKFWSVRIDYRRGEYVAGVTRTHIGRNLPWAQKNHPFGNKLPF